MSLCYNLDAVYIENTIYIFISPDVQILYIYCLLFLYDFLCFYSIGAELMIFCTT